MGNRPIGFHWQILDDQTPSAKARAPTPTLNLYRPSPLPSATALNPQPPNPAVRGVQRNLQLETQHKDLADDAKKRIHALQQGRESILQRLGKQFTVRSSAAATG
ncbi:hypothetical protein V500_02051 [Pseudogymnoascus sp. VKM F-4518 (FW-2643)]|nr:hypothetical protein V500_02051 [Pseudogymnoascus sp. VKM F-4518 (FW-2643)]